jgi:hypothetical protein
LNRQRPFLAYGILLVAVLTGFSGTFPSGHSGHKNGPGSTPLSHVEEIYAPFDTLRTDLKDYIWPTNASTVITSSFADYRRTHLHEGVDISTNNQNGYPVYASRSGYVSRIFISRRGYGKMLYVRHRDGFVTMYAHLQRFYGAIDDYAKKLQKQNKRYSLEVDIDPKMFPVEKGNLIAYTGETGIGSSHLHFEVRDSALNPINPFLLPQIAAAVSDQIPPHFDMVAFTPLTGGSKAQGRTRTWVADATKENPAEYALPDPVKISGLIGISVRATDQADVLKYRTGAFRFEMYIDGKLVFTSAKKFILDSEAHQVLAYYDRNLLRARKGRFEKLYVEYGNRLPFYNRMPEGTGPIDTSELEPGEHHLRIVTWDLSNNESSLTAMLTVSPTAKR